MQDNGAHNAQITAIANAIDAGLIISSENIQRLLRETSGQEEPTVRDILLENGATEESAQGLWHPDGDWELQAERFRMGESIVFIVDAERFDFAYNDFTTEEIADKRVSSGQWKWETKSGRIYPLGPSNIIEIEEDNDG